jgi:hypothetical protein
LEGITKRYGIKDLDVEAIFQDITIFPILDDENRVIYIGALTVNYGRLLSVRFSRSIKLEAGV